MGGSGLDRNDDFKNLVDQDWIRFNFIGSGLNSDLKFSQSPHLCNIASFIPVGPSRIAGVGNLWPLGPNATGVNIWYVPHQNFRYQR